MTHKQVIIIRKDLNMRKGKMVAQGAHASLGAILGVGLDDKRITPWLRGSFAKVCVYVNSEEEILLLHTKAKHLGLVSCLITDSGKTEFSGVPTITALAIGPDTIERVDQVTKDLPLL